MLGRKLDKHVLERRADYMNLDMTNPDFEQLSLNLCSLDVFIDQQMHRLAKNGSAADSAPLVHGMQCRGHMIASHIEPARSRRIYLLQVSYVVRRTGYHQFPPLTL